MISGIKGQKAKNRGPAGVCFISSPRRCGMSIFGTKGGIAMNHLCELGVFAVKKFSTIGGANMPYPLRNTPGDHFKDHFTPHKFCRQSSLSAVILQNLSRRTVLISFRKL